jgi:hypothetical protein
MHLRQLIGVILATLLFKQGAASKVVTVSDGDWDEPFVWSGNAVPSNPDTIIIRYYITFSRDLVIQAPTVLIIEQGATLCGDYLLDISCGAKVYNHYRLYVNKLNVRDGENYFELHAKNNITVTGCSIPGFGGGYKNIPPYASTYVWPPVLCKTTATHYPRELELGIITNNGDQGISVFPNPVNSGALKISTDQHFDYHFTDICGRQISSGSGENFYEISLANFPAGLYFLSIKKGTVLVTYKIIKE